MSEPFEIHATCIALIWQAVPPLKKAMAPTLGTEWGAVVIVYAAFSFGMMLTQLPGGTLGDKYPLRYVVGVGAVFAGAGPGGCAQVKVFKRDAGVVLRQALGEDSVQVGAPAQGGRFASPRVTP